MPDFKEGQVENRDKTGKMLNFQSFEMENFYRLSLNGEKPPPYYSDPKYPL